jgi:type III secretion protein L
MATILKAQGPTSRRLEASALAARDAAREVEEEAAAAARRLVEEARADAEEVRRRARDAGREEGLAEATEALARAAAQRDRLLAGLGPELVQLALEVARRVVGAAAERDPDVVVGSATRAIAAARHRASLTLHVNPDDLAAIGAADSRLAALAGGRAIAVVADGAVARGGAVVETEAGSVDARLEPQLDALARALAGARR